MLKTLHWELKLCLESLLVVLKLQWWQCVVVWCSAVCVMVEVDHLSTFILGFNQVQAWQIVLFPNHQILGLVSWARLAEG